MDDWEKFNESTLPKKKKEFYSKLHADYMYPKRVCKDFQIKNVGEFHDLYLKSDILLLADINH